MNQCSSPEAIIKLINDTITDVVQQYILCGTLQGGLKACESESYLPRDSHVVICEQLAELVQEAIDAKEIIAPTVVEVRTNGTVLELRKADGTILTTDLYPVVELAVGRMFVDCNGDKIAVGTALATCANMTALRQALEAADHLIRDELVAGDTALRTAMNAEDQALRNEINRLRTDLGNVQTTLSNTDTYNYNLLEQRIQGLRDSLGQQINAETARWANTVLQELFDELRAKKDLYHDNTLQGGGTEANPLGVNIAWFNDAVAARLRDVFRFTDCCGDEITVDSVLVTCACLEQQVTALTNSLQAYADEAANRARDQAVVAANTYTDAKAQQTLQAANAYTDNKVGNPQIVAVDTSTVDLQGNGTTATPLSATVRLSGDGGNLLEARGDGLYYGVQAPPDLSNFYVDSLNGSDDNAGTTPEAPFKTLAKAQTKITGRLNQNIHLHGGDDRPVYVLHGMGISAGILTIVYYGIDDQRPAGSPTSGCLWENGAGKGNMPRPKVMPFASYIAEFNKNATSAVAVSGTGRVDLVGLHILPFVQNPTPSGDGWWDRAMLHADGAGEIRLRGVLIDFDYNYDRTDGVVVWVASGAFGMDGGNVVISSVAVKDTKNTTGNPHNLIQSMKITEVYSGHNECNNPNDPQDIRTIDQIYGSIIDYIRRDANTTLDAKFLPNGVWYKPLTNFDISSV